MKVFTAEHAKQIAELTEKLKGTDDFGKYYMSLEYKRGKKWEYIGWSIPPTNADGTIKKYRDKTYIMYEVQGEQRRYTMTNEIKSLLENNQNTQKEDFNMNLTALEEKTMIEIGSKDGNGEYIRNSGFHEQYMSIFLFTTPMKQLRGVFASLVKKGLIEIFEDEYDNLIKVTDLGLKYLETKGL